MRRTVVYKILSLTFAFMLCVFAVFPTRKDLKVFSPSVTASTVTRLDYRLEMPTIYAESAVVMDAKSKSLLFAKGERISRGMASTTKIMTALVAIENCHPDVEFQIPAQAVGVEGSSVYLAKDEPLTLRELLYCLLLESGNDAATAIAVCVGGSLEGFVDLMNRRATEMGLTQTHFANPHGLNDSQHYTTAEELALITAEAMDYPLFREIVATKTFNVRRNGKENGRTLYNHNKLLGNFEGAVGVKTGYTIKDGKCLVSAAERDGLLLIAVSLKDSSPIAHHKIMLENAFDKFENRTLANQGDITTSLPVIDGEKDFVSLTNEENIEVCLPKDSDFEIVLDIPENLNATIIEGEIYGKARVLHKGKEVYIIDLTATETIKIKEKSFWEKLFGE